MQEDFSFSLLSPRFLLLYLFVWREVFFYNFLSFFLLSVWPTQTKGAVIWAGPTSNPHFALDDWLHHYLGLVVSSDPASWCCFVHTAGRILVDGRINSLPLWQNPWSPVINPMRKCFCGLGVTRITSFTHFKLCQQYWEVFDFSWQPLVACYDRLGWNAFGEIIYTHRGFI